MIQQSKENLGDGYYRNHSLTDLKSKVHNSNH